MPVKKKVKTKELLLADRVERFEQLRFTPKEAELLASATVREKVKTKDGDRYVNVPLHPSIIRKMLSQGCTHKTACRIFAPL